MDSTHVARCLLAMGVIVSALSGCAGGDTRTADDGTAGTAAQERCGGAGPEFECSPVSPEKATAPWQSARATGCTRDDAAARLTSLLAQRYQVTFAAQDAACGLAPSFPRCTGTNAGEIPSVASDTAPCGGNTSPGATVCVEHDPCAGGPSPSGNAPVVRSPTYSWGTLDEACDAAVAAHSCS